MKTWLIFVICILENTILLHYKNFITQLQYGIDLVGRKLFEFF